MTGSIGGKDSFLEMALGHQPEKSVVHVSAWHNNVPTTERHIWTKESEFEYVPPGDAEKLIAVSTDAADDNSGGSGARKLMVKYIGDVNLDIVEETLNLAGTSNSDQTTEKCVRLLSAGTSHAGDYGANNAGVITLKHVTEGTVLGKIEKADGGAGRLFNARYSVPAGYKAIMISRGVKCLALGTNTTWLKVRLYRREMFDVESAPYGAACVEKEWEFFSKDHDNKKLYAYPVFPEKTDIWWTAKCDHADGAKVKVTMDLVLVG